ncbi:MAG: sigma-54 factor interaction domain-containing protein [Candidatus Omnitrophica bacterium]|nr:sigma-54 factor interaction domain-containing protein [Candidatus Omnitrophota bacterium]MCG2703204.1 sigma-54 factor interaction domain-containing protein [Candidatus Omnitrophota bacterium]
MAQRIYAAGCGILEKNKPELYGESGTGKRITAQAIHRHDFICLF